MLGILLSYSSCKVCILRIMFLVYSCLERINIFTPTEFRNDVRYSGRWPPSWTLNFEFFCVFRIAQINLRFLMKFREDRWEIIVSEIKFLTFRYGCCHHFVLKDERILFSFTSSWPFCICRPNFMMMGQRLWKLQPKIEFQNGGCCQHGYGTLLWWFLLIRLLVMLLTFLPSLKLIS